jgi:hypothetical protein
MGEEIKKKFLPYRSTFRKEWIEILDKRLNVLGDNSNKEVLGDDT